MSNEIKINNSDYYCSEMSKSLLDKMFFMDKIFEPFETVLDFGCADGALLALCKKLFPEYRYVGYDNSPEMIAKAKELHPDIEFYSDFDDAIAVVNVKETILILSSVVHEIASYCTKEEATRIGNKVFRSGFKYICIRDMTYTGNIGSVDAFEFDSQINLASKVRHLKYILENHPTLRVRKCLADFEEAWGMLELGDFTKKAAHFLFKLLYMNSPNWDRELKEDYLPYSEFELQRILHENIFFRKENAIKYRETFYESYKLPYIIHKLKDEIGIPGYLLDLLLPKTHFKMILRINDDTA